MHTAHSVAQEWNQNILRNLKQEFGDQLKGMSDIDILDEFDVFTRSDDGSITFGEWCNGKGVQE